MADDDVRIAQWNLRATAGTTVSRPFTATTAVTTVAVYTGGTVVDVDDLTGATEHPATVDAGGLGGTITLDVPTGNSVPLRLVVDGAVVAVGRLTPSTTGTDTRDDTVTIATAEASTLTLELPAIVVNDVGADDQTAAEVPFAPSGTIEATDVQAAIVELDSDLVTEATTRAAADTALSDSLTTEQVVRADADAALDGRVDALEAVDPLVTADVGTTVQAHSPVLDATTASFTLADETKLDGIAEGAEVNAVDSVDGRTGAVSLTDLYDAAGSAAAAEAAANTYTDTAVDNATARSFVSGRYYDAGHGSNLGVGSMDLNQAIARSFPVDKATSFDRIGIVIQGLATAGGVMRLGIYADNAGVPGAPIVRTAALPTDGFANLNEAIILASLPTGMYWLAGVFQVASPNMRRFLGGGGGDPNIGTDDPAGDGFAPLMAYVQNGVTGALPDTFVVHDVKTNIAPRIFVRAV